MEVVRGVRVTGREEEKPLSLRRKEKHEHAAVKRQQLRQLNLPLDNQHQQAENVYDQPHTHQFLMYTHADKEYNSQQHTEQKRKVVQQQAKNWV
jgi:hypothetical protein